MLHFEYKQSATPYHFAINIPANKEFEALKWLKSRCPILKDGEDEIINFTAWNAKAIYFYDEDKNIVELIARKNLKNASDHNFGPEHFLEISEIGVPTTDIEREFNTLKHAMDIAIYDGGFGNFCAIGDENGLLICINRERKDWYPTQDKASPSEFELKLSQNRKTYGIEFKNEKIIVGFP
ncbi:VOC family protein [Arenibacter sp. BSSL-BM3]|uniref:VOC family protein n=1 Tax=Arenibacter arenosicollis TaxID=2762274 RepID=A0ABR7QMZ7_9FLAO|nr:VOC family protein [Arenibacter arenosicollis]MBC8768564.1 VOC family protein [Arenibacter arenosicollis]